jgi:SAM-dependent methyltransferase
MVPRLFDWQMIRGADFTLLDLDRVSLAAAREEIARFADRVVDDAPGCPLVIEKQGTLSRIAFEQTDALAYLTAEENLQRHDVVVANAVLDVLDLRPAVAGVLRVLKPGGPFWLTINFDGETIFQPEHPLDSAVMQLYHLTMDERMRDGRPCGDSKTGRHLLPLLPELGGRVAMVGSSDWVVFPQDNGYPADEAYFLHHIVNTIAAALDGHPELDPARFGDWVRLRHEQVERAALIYIAHQLDVLGTAPAT